MATQTQRGAISRSSLGDEVYRVLWQRILARRLRPGDKLSDLRLSDELGVSRTPVREALQRLVQDGIVRAEPNRGFFVTSFAPGDVAEVYDLRAALEVMALRISAPSLSSKDLHHQLDELDRVEALLATATSPDARLDAVNAFLEIDRGFHRWFVQRAGNRRLTATVEGLWAQIAVFQQAGGFLPDLPAQAISHHRAIISALLAGDFPEAIAQLERHIYEVKARTLADIADQQDWFDDGLEPADQAGDPA